jgi:hypothetical protein
MGLDPANRAEAMQLLIDRLQLAPDIAAKSYALAVAPPDGPDKDAKFDPEGLRNALQLRAEFENDWGSLQRPSNDTSTRHITTRPWQDSNSCKPVCARI